MTSLRKLSFQGRRLLSAGTPPRDSKLDDKYIQAEIRQITHALIKAEWFSLKNQGETAVSPYCIATYDNQAVIEASDGRNYTLLPCQPMNLNGGEGIQQVRPQTGNADKDKAMIPIQPQELEMFRSTLFGLEVMKDQFCWEPDRDRIWFSDMDGDTPLDKGIDEVQIRMVVIDPNQIEEDDPYPIPPEMEIQILEKLLVMHGYNAQQAHDMVNDGK